MFEGNKWKDWDVDNLIGEGSFGKVYKISKEDFGYTYKSALKVIEIPQNKSEIKVIRSEGMTDESITSYFKSMVEDIVEEFVLMSKLKGNSNIVSYEDHMVVPKEDEFGWEIYIRMELLTPMLEYLDNHTLSVKEVVQLGIDICNALEVCQKYNIIHRDIKPENIFVSDIGTFKLGDFGIARQLEKTSSGLSKKGTYTYMAPEVYKGMPYDSTVDIYSLGIVMYRFLNNNRSPFMPPAPQTIKFSDKETSNLLRFSGQTLPRPCNANEQLAEIILKACAYDPVERYQKPEEMRNNLQAVLHLLNNGLISDKINYQAQNLKRDSEAIEDDCTEYMNDATEYMDDEKTVIMQCEELSENQEDEHSNISVEEVEEELPQEQEKVAIENKPINKKRKINNELVVAIIFIIVTVLIVGSAIAYSLLNNEDKPDEVSTAETTTQIVSVEIPAITGKTLNEATDILSQQGLTISVFEEVYSDDVEEGRIISQTPEYGTMPVGGNVAVSVSKGKKLIDVPDVLEMKSGKAEALLDELGLLVVTKYKHSDIIDEDYVIKQSLAQGKKVPIGTKITITISKGKKESSADTNYTQQDEHTITEKVKSLGNYSESHVLSSKKIDIIRNSVESAVSGTQNKEYVNLARYMANNNKSNANSTYSELTNGNINVNQKVKSVKIDSDDQTEIMNVAQKMVSSVGVKAKNVGVAISSQSLTVGYRITVVVVYD